MGIGAETQRTAYFNWRDCHYGTVSADVFNDDRLADQSSFDHSEATADGRDGGLLGIPVAGLVRLAANGCDSLPAVGLVRVRSAYSITSSARASSVGGTSMPCRYGAEALARQAYENFSKTLATASPPVSPAGQ
jgi:hypothetical protein